jgi:hypothetical protein
LYVNPDKSTNAVLFVTVVETNGTAKEAFVVELTLITRPDVTVDVFDLSECAAEPQK